MSYNYIEFEPNQKFALPNAIRSNDHNDFNDCGYLLKDNELVVGIDNVPREEIEKFLQAFNIKTQIVWTDRGAHLYFQRPDNFNGSKGKVGFDAIQEVEYKHAKNSPNGVTIKRNGVLRTIENEGAREEIPSSLIAAGVIYEIVPYNPPEQFEGTFDFNLFLECVKELNRSGYFDEYDPWYKFVFAIVRMYQEGRITETQAKFICTQIDCGDESTFDLFERNKESNITIGYGSVVKIMKDNGITEILKVSKDNKFLNHWKRDLKKNQFGSYIANQSNFEIILQNDDNFKGLLGFNEFTRKIEAIGTTPWKRVAQTQAWEDSDEQNLRVYMSREYGVAAKDSLNDVLSTIAYDNKFHPVKSYFERLPQWDSKERLNSIFIDYMGAPDTELIREQTFLFFMAIINRIYEPGCKWDYTVVLLGDQGLGKSSFVRNLTPSAEWFTDSLESVEGKDTMQLLNGKLIVEMAEMSATSRKEAEKVKSFMTRQVDEYRASYGRNTTYQPRQCVFIGTTNDEQFINDDTGGRRWWVFKVSKKWFDVEKQIGTIDITQLWAEAMYLYKKFRATQGVLKLSNELEQKANEVQRQHMMLGTYEGEIVEGLDKNDCGFKPGARICAKTVWEMILRHDISGKEIKQTDIKRINAIIRNHKDWVEVGRQRVKNYGLQTAFEMKG